MEEEELMIIILVVTAVVLLVSEVAAVVEEEVAEAHKRQKGRDSCERTMRQTSALNNISADLSRYFCMSLAHEKSVSL